MIYLLILSGMFIAAGLFLLLANALKIPYLKTSKAIMNAGREDKKISKSLDAIMIDIATKIGRIIRMDKYKRIRLEKTLTSAGIKMTPETFTAYAIFKSFYVILEALSELGYSFEWKGSAENLRQIIPDSQGSRVYDTNGVDCTQCAGSGGGGGKTGLYFIDQNVNPKITDHARCITTRQS